MLGWGKNEENLFQWLKKPFNKSLKINLNILPQKSLKSYPGFRHFAWKHRIFLLLSFFIS